jgi:hypothetical protein
MTIRDLQRREALYVLAITVSVGPENSGACDSTPSLATMLSMTCKQLLNFFTVRIAAPPWRQISRALDS